MIHNIQFAGTCIIDFAMKPAMKPIMIYQRKCNIVFRWNGEVDLAADRLPALVALLWIVTGHCLVAQKTDARSRLAELANPLIASHPGLGIFSLFEGWSWALPAIGKHQ